MKLLQEDLWAHQSDLIVVTTNGVLNRSNRLVMGKGAALDAMRRHPDLPSIAGAEILAKGYPHVPQLGNMVYIYGFIGFKDRGLGIFQTKFHWKALSDLELIDASTSLLDRYIREHHIKSVRMNFPGISNGGLTMKSVLPIIDRLPDSVTVVYQ